MLSLAAAPFQWARHVASTINGDNELAIGLALDGATNLYVTGWFDGTNDFGNGIVLTNTPGGGQDMFVAKYNSAGVALWARQGGGNTQEWDGGRGIGVDAAGNVYVAGQFYGEADFDGFRLTGANNSRLFLAKYDSDGVIQWARQSTGDWTHYGSGLTVDDAGNSYVAGYIDDGFGNIFPVVTFDEDTSLTNTNNGFGTFLVKFDASGNALWAELLESSRACYSTAISLDPGGNIYVGGNFRETLRIQTTQFTNGGEKDGFLAKFNSAGVLQWARQITGGSDCSTLGISANVSGYIYAVGGFASGAGDTACFDSLICVTNRGGAAPGSGIGDGFLAKYNALSGAALWAVGAGGTNLDAFLGVHASTNGNVYVAGGFGGVGIPTGFQAVISAYDTNGIEQWTQSSTGTGGALSWAGPVVDPAGDCYVAGWFQTNATFGTDALTGRGYWDFFLAKVGAAPQSLALNIEWEDPLPQISVIGQIGTRFILEYTPTLPAVSWQPLLTNTLSTVPFIYADTGGAGISSRFYRARLVP